MTTFESNRVCKKQIDTDKKKKRRERNNDEVSAGGDGGMSIEETNRLRIELGLGTQASISFLR